MFDKLWKDKYSPKTVNEYVCSESMKKDLLQYVQEGSIPNILLASDAGFGKTSLAKLLVKELNAEHIYINSSEERSIDVVRESIITFASTYSFSKIKVVILDEADGMTPQALDSLKGVIEKYQEHVRYIVTTNQINKLPAPIIDRFDAIYHLENVPKGAIAKRCFEILKLENISFEKEQLVNVINYYYPSIRKIVSSLQMCSMNGVLEFDSSKISKDYFHDVIEIINSKNSNEDKFYKIRQIFLDADLKNIDEIYSLFFSHLKLFSKSKDCEITITLAEGLHKSVTIPDKELNLMATISEILTIVK